MSGHDGGQYETTDRGLHSQGSSSSEKPKQEKSKLDKGKFEQLAHLGALGATAIAKYEGEQARKAAGDAASVERHRKQEKLANSVALGLGGFAMQETQQSASGHEASHTSTANPNPNPNPNPTSQPNSSSQHTSQPTSQPTSEAGSNHSSSKPSSGSPQDYFDKFEEGKKLLQSFLNKK